MFQAARRFFTRDPHAALKKVLGDMPLPSFTHTTQRVLRGLRNPETALSVVGEHIAADPGLSLDVLRMVNSAAYSLRRPVADAAHAARLLGRAELESLVLTVVVRKTIPSTPVPGYDPKTFWHGATRRAAVAKTIADTVHPATARQAFTGVLLQDMALPLLAHANPDGYRALLQEASTRLERRERDRYGWDHAEVASWLCDAWSLPAELRQTISTHHDPDASPAIRIAALVPEQGGDLEPVIETARDKASLSPEATHALLERAAALTAELMAAA